MAENLYAVAAPAADEPIEPEEPRHSAASRVGEVIELSEEERENLAHDLRELCVAWDDATESRRKRIEEIEDAFQLVPDPTRGGLMPDSSAWPSELTRSYCKLAAARMWSGLQRKRLAELVVAHPGRGGEEAEALRRFADDFNEWAQHFTWTRSGLDAGLWLYLVLLATAKFGMRITKLDWHTDNRVTFYRDEDGNTQESKRRVGRPKVTVVPNSMLRLWPPVEHDVDELDMIGFKNLYTKHELRAQLKELEVEKDVIEEICSWRKSEGQAFSEEEAASLKGVDVRDPGQPDAAVAADYELTELWCRFPLPGDHGDGSLLWTCWFHEPSGTVAKVRNTPFNHGRAPFIDWHCWRSTGGFLSQGFGDELLFSQAADSAIFTLALDNLRVIGAFVRIIRSNSRLEDMQDQILPGANLVTDNPEEDIRFEALGENLGEIWAAAEQVRDRASDVTGITSVMRGEGDKTLKSGASPSSQYQLMSAGDRTFDHVDENTARSLERLYTLLLHLLQQFGGDRIWTDRMQSDDPSETLGRLALSRPSGDLDDLYQVRVTARSITNPRELQQQLLLQLSIFMQNLEPMMGLAAQVYSDNPRALKDFQTRALEFQSEVLNQALSLGEIEGYDEIELEPPKPTPWDQRIAQMVQMIQQLQQRVVQLTQVLQASGGQPQGAGPRSPSAAPGPPAAGPPRPGPPPR